MMEIIFVCFSSFGVAWSIVHFYNEWKYEKQIQEG